MQLNWLPHKHTAKLHIGSISNPADVTASFIFAFKGEEILLAQVYSRGWDIPGGHRERAETAEECITRELFEECATSPIIMGELGELEITLEGDTPPQAYPYPFPTSTLAFFWGVVDNIGKPSASMEVGEAKLFSVEDALKIDSIKALKPLFDEAYARAKIVNDKLKALENA